MQKRILVIMVCCTVVGLLCAPAYAGNRPHVRYAEIDAEQNVVSLFGWNFGGNMGVVLGVEELAILSVSENLIEAQLPEELAPGTYKCIVTKYKKSKRNTA